jgi:glycosyltransferase involved in cell wall biosynthesis
MAVEVLTAYISPNKIKRFFHNSLTSFESRLFRNVISTTEGMAKYLHLPKRTHIIPNGSESTAFIRKEFDSIRILYVGTFHNRNITNTIHAYARFFNEYNNQIKINYTIIGFGSKVETNEIITTINNLDMNNYIAYKGVIRRPELNEYFKNSNIGISYIPINTYFDHQAPLKAYEYLLSGLTVLATATKENAKIITKKNGIIIGDSVEDVYIGLKKIYNNRSLYNSESIQKDAQKYSWENIVRENMIPYIEKW